MQSFNEDMIVNTSWAKKGCGDRVCSVLEKAAQLAQIIIAITMIALSVQFHHMTTLVANMKLDQGRDSPVTEILASGIQVRCCAIDELF